MSRERSAVSYVEAHAKKHSRAAGNTPFYVVLLFIRTYVMHDPYYELLESR